MDRRKFLQLVPTGAIWASRPVHAGAVQDAVESVVVLGEGKAGIALGSEALAGTRQAPCSTFKIPLALMALEEGLLTDADQKRPVDPTTFEPEPWWTPEMLDSWNRPHSLRTAFHASAIWFFRRLALQLGPERMAAYLAVFDYGDRDFSGGLDNFWNAGDRGIGISPQEQWRFLLSVAKARLPLKRSTFETAFDVFVTERQGGTVLRAKTGLGWRGASGASPAVGWYVGWLEGPAGTVPFASLSAGAGFSEVRAVRIENARRLLRERGMPG